MISEKMTKSLNHQINREVFSGYLYLGMSAKMINLGLNGFANWFAIQMREEFFHAQKIYDYVNQCGEMVELEPIEAPDQNFASPMEAFVETLEHEKKVTAMINNLMDLAISEKDHATESFLRWFVDEQVEEEANATDAIQKLKLAGDNSGSLFMLDAEMGKRVFAETTA